MSERNERMLGYYPTAISSVLEFKAITDTDASELDAIPPEIETIPPDAYWLTMSERRIIQWEKRIGIEPPENSTLERRRNAIIGKINGSGKLNTKLINDIVMRLSGDTCDCWVDDGVLHVKLRVTDENEATIEHALTDIETELSRKIPAHLTLNVKLNYNLWSDVYNNNANWKTVQMAHETWDDVLYNRRTPLNKLNYSALDEFYLGLGDY